MFSKSVLQELINRPGFSQKDSICLILGCDIDSPKSITKIKLIGKEAGLRVIEKWNVANALGKAKGLVVRISDGWILTNEGKEYISNLAGLKNKRTALKTIANDLRKLINTLPNLDTQLFLNEALSCFETGNYRATVVLSWVGAVHILYQYVVDNILGIFNTEALRRDSKWKTAKTIDDLGRMKEKDFLDILVTLSALGKNVKQELMNCLDLRNGSGHPNSLKIGENRAAGHLETLILNVYSKF